jgi:hypothetical protein
MRKYFYNGVEYTSVAELLEAIKADKGVAFAKHSTAFKTALNKAKTAVPAGGNWEVDLDWVDLVGDGAAFLVAETAVNSWVSVKNKAQLNTTQLASINLLLTSARVTNISEAGSSHRVQLEFITAANQRIEGRSNTNYFKTLNEDKDSLPFEMKNNGLCPNVQKGQQIRVAVRAEKRIGFDGKNALGQLHGNTTVGVSTAATTWSSIAPKDLERAKAEGGYIDTDSQGKPRAHFFHNAGDGKAINFRSFLSTVPTEKEWNAEVENAENELKRVNKLHGETETIKGLADAKAYEVSVVRTAEVQANAQANLFTAKAAREAAPYIKEIMVEFSCTLLEAQAYFRSMQQIEQVAPVK